MSFRNKTAIVTGAGQGIGFEICRQLAAAGANIILNDIDPVLAAQAARQLTGDEDCCRVIAGDSGSLACIQQMVDTAVADFGALDIVIANAGITLFGDFFEYTFQHHHLSLRPPQRILRKSTKSLVEIHECYPKNLLICQV